MVTKLSYHDSFLDKQVEIVCDKSVLINKNKIIDMASMPLPIKSFILQCRIYTYLHLKTLFKNYYPSFKFL